jgi:catechol 2,3-dioxygenase-like lactoylglutathione lyase family enzyme
VINPDARDWIFKQISHVGLIVVDIEKTIEEYGRLGYTFALREGTVQIRRPGMGPQDPFSARSAWSLQGPPHIELGEVVGKSSEPQIWVDRGHDYVDHAGYWVDDLEKASATLEACGFPLELAPAGDDTRPLGFCYHRTPSGARIELEDGPMRRAILEQQFERVRQGETGVMTYTPFASE